MINPLDAVVVDALSGAQATPYHAVIILAVVAIVFTDFCNDLPELQSKSNLIKNDWTGGLEYFKTRIRLGNLAVMIQRIDFGACRGEVFIKILARVKPVDVILKCK